MKEKKLRIITEILAIVVIVLVSFVGVFTQQANKVENKVKGYNFTKNLSGYREAIFEVSDAVQVQDADGKVVGNTDSYTDETIQAQSYVKTETKINSDENLTEENYKKSKAIIEERLKKLNVQDYNIGLDKQTGKMYLQIPEDGETDHALSNILQVSKFEIKDSNDNSKVFLTNKDLKNVSAVYDTTQEGTTVYLQMELNKEGTNILKDLSTGEYKTKDEEESTETNTTEDENAVKAEATVSTENATEENTAEENTAEENTTEENQTQENATEQENTAEGENTEESTEESEETEEDTQNKITISVDENELISTSFDDPIENGVISLSMNKASKDNKEISDTLQSTSTISFLLNSGEMPITYKVSDNQYVNNEVFQLNLKTVAYVVAGIAAILLIVLIIKFRLRGFLASISYIGFVALYLLLIRYTNVQTSIESICAICVTLILNYIVVKNLLKINETDEEMKKQIITKEFLSTIAKLFPIFIVSIVFSFIYWTSVMTFGMTMFWGIFLMVIYNYVLTRDMIN